MKRLLVHALAVVAVAAVVAVPGSASAETCLPVPVGTGGFTLEAGGQQVRIPAINSVAVCYEVPGLPGIPWVYFEYGGASVVITGGSGTDGHVTVRVVADGSTREVGVPIPSGGGGGNEICLVGVGSPSARPDCAVKLHADDLDPSPLPTLPPTPTVEPLPTVEPCAPRPIGCAPPIDLEDPVGSVIAICNAVLPEFFTCGE
ncbi:MAG: hypothetical protein M3279_02140 [Actinomycetota bacterium]|nr:hypothetical protein [Actinomycetota bacterium]